MQRHEGKRVKMWHMYFKKAPDRKHVGLHADDGNQKNYKCFSKQLFTGEESLVQLTVVSW